ncbi:MAG: transglutaminase [Alphaproteobacteria bacterium MedPE-SWcel]|nr:MAG: transglutaminase [Alphaproteobacteria bacterium MedPE-SWcel]
MVDVTRLSIRHITTYSYEQPVHYALQKLRLTPRSGHGQSVVEWSSTVTGGRKQLVYDDPLMNHTELVKVDSGATHVEIVSEGIVDVEDRHGVIGRHSGFAPLWLYETATPLTAAGNNVRHLAAQLRQETDGMDDLSRMHRLAADIGTAVQYEIGQTNAGTTAEMALTAGHGVCQDHAHIMIATARHLGYPARYISGYLLMDGQTGQDASHAWCEIHLETLGWIGFDVSNGICPDGRYVRVAVGRDYGDAAPIVGIRQGDGAEALTVSLQVQQ